MNTKELTAQLKFDEDGWFSCSDTEALMKAHDSIRHQKQGLGLVSIVEGAGVELRRSGSLYTARCPFHEDRIPSFFVFPDGHWHCFSCQVGGDVIDFVKKYYQCDFKQALKHLGIKEGRLTAREREKVKKLKHGRELVQDFRQWETDAADEVALLCRCARKVLGNIGTEADFEKYGDLYHGLETWQYHLDILASGDDEAKFRLYEAQYYG